MTEKHTKFELDLLHAIEHEEVISQATLSRRLGIAVGLVNFLVKRAVKKGIVVTERVPARRYAYFLTPKGFAEKAKLVADYMNSSLGIYRKLREDFDELFKQLTSEGRYKIVIIGDLELIELAILSALDTEIEVVAVVCDKTNRKTVAKKQVISHIDMLSEEPIDITYLVVDIYRAQPVYENLVEKYGAENVRAPKSLYVAPYSTTQRKLFKKSVQ